MNAIIARPVTGASPTAPKPTTRKQKTEQTPSPAAARTASPADWRAPVRAVLDPVFDVLSDLVDPTSGSLPTDLAGELVTHAKEGLRQVLLIGDAEPVWEDTTSLLAETLWTRDSLTAAAELAVIHGWTHSAGRSLAVLEASCNAVSAVCAALEEYDGEKRAELLQTAGIVFAGAWPSRNLPQGPVRRAPAELSIYSNMPGETCFQSRDELQSFVLKNSVVISNLSTCLHGLLANIGSDEGPDYGFISGLSDHINDIVFLQENATKLLIKQMPGDAV